MELLIKTKKEIYKNSFLQSFKSLNDFNEYEYEIISLIKQRLDFIIDTLF
jgi:hypothetical protein